jgi:indole-3-glycerol phosphate synthase
MPDFLRSIAAASRRRVRAARARVTEAELLRRAGQRPCPPSLRRSGSGFDIFAEFKPRSPSRGVLLTNPERGPAIVGAAYARGGACALSVLTEPVQFGGSLEALSELARESGLPTMRKDFLVDPYQVIEARAHGASGVLLIARLLEAAALEELIDAAGSMDLFVLVEAFDLEELERAAAALSGACGVGLLGVNARDLTTLAIDTRRHAELAARAPRGVPLVAESGIATPADAMRVSRLGYSAALVGEALMRVDDPVPLLQAMIACGREAAAVRKVGR